MIGIITKGSGFGGVFAYILGEDKDCTQLPFAQQCVSNEPEKLAREFQYIANFRSRTTQPVRHFSIAFAPEDKIIDVDDKTEIAVRIMEEMGFGDSQYFAVAHSRVDKNHHGSHDHDHIHIVANAIKPNGEKVDHFWDYRKLEKCLREIEIDYGLRQMKNSWEIRKVTELVDSPGLQGKIDKALVSSPNLKEWIDRLEASGVNLRFRLTRNGCVQGVSYVHDGRVLRGGDIDRNWKSVSARLEPNPEQPELIEVNPILSDTANKRLVQSANRESRLASLELMESANLKTQSLSVTLSQDDQELLTKAADLAVQKLVDKGKDDFKDKSVEISIVDDVLTVRRLRPNKQILAAKKDESGEWKSIGIPNIDPKKDLQILGCIKEKDFQALKDRIETSPRSDIPDGNPVNHLRSIANIKPKLVPETNLVSSTNVRSNIPDGNPVNHLRSIANIEPKLVPETNLVSSTNVETLSPEEKVIVEKFIAPTIEPMDRELSEMSDAIELVEISESKISPKLIITKKNKTTKDRGF